MTKCQNEIVAGYFVDVSFAIQFSALTLPAKFVDVGGIIHGRPVSVTVLLIRSEKDHKIV